MIDPLMSEEKVARRSLFLTFFSWPPRHRGQYNTQFRSSCQLFFATDNLQIGIYWIHSAKYIAQTENRPRKIRAQMFPLLFLNDCRVRNDKILTDPLLDIQLKGGKFESFRGLCSADQILDSGAAFLFFRMVQSFVASPRWSENLYSY